MEISHIPKKELRSKIGRIATAIGFALVIGSVSVGTVRAADHRGDGNHGHGGEQHHDNGNHGYHGGYGYSAPRQDYYYAPQPNYYYAPEPDQYYGPNQEYDAPPSPGISLFFGL